MTKQRMSNTKVKILAIAALLILCGFAVFLTPQIAKLQTTYEIQQFFPKSYAGFEDLVGIKKVFKLEQHPSLAVLVRNDTTPWTNPEQMEKLEKFSSSVGRIPSLRSTISLPGRQAIYQDKESIRIGSLVKMLPESSWREAFLKDPLAVPTLLSADLKTALVFAELGTTDVGAYATTLEQIEKASKENFTGEKVLMGGIPAIQNSFKTLLRNELSRFLVLSLIASLLLVVLLFRRHSGWIMTIITLLWTNIFVIGLMGFLGWPFTVLSTTVPILVTVIVVSQVVYSYFRMHEIESTERAAGRATEKAPVVWEINKEIFFPNFLCHFTTAVGFWTLSFSEIPLISNYGHVVAGCVFIAWISTTLFLFPLMMFFPSPVPRDWTQIDFKFITALLNRRKPIVIGVVAISIIASTGALFLNWGARLFDDLPRNHESRIATELIDEQLGGLIPIEAEISAPDADYWKTPENLERLKKTVASLRERPAVGSALSVPDFVGLFSDNLSLPKTKEAIAEIFFLYGLSARSPLENYLSANGMQARIGIKMRDIPAKDMIAESNAILDRLRTDFPEVKVRTTGTGVYLHPMNTTVSRELIFGFWHAMAAIALVLVFVFRSVKWALIACIPNLVPPAALLGIMAITQTPIKPVLALVFSISLGLAFNNTVYVLMRIKDLIRQGKTENMIENVMKLEAPACFFSTLVVLAGFVVFLGAQFSVNQVFGLYMIIATIGGLVGDLIFFPAFLKWFPDILTSSRRQS